MNKFTFSPIDGSSIDAVMDIQERAFEVMEDRQILRANSREMLLDCLENHYGIGVFATVDGEEKMVAFGTLYFPGAGEENLAQYLYDEIEDYDIYANMKLIIVLPEYRGNGLQRSITEVLEYEARRRGIKELFCTVSPYNHHSYNNMMAIGYEFVKLVEGKYNGAARNVYHKRLI
ncbi:MAG: GNAT family N-acetyltransferase [Flavobacteriales bacterium]|jgi:ribosomal protein S18 acetylase RimI-like enzyme|nr:GNAT family N-acetyltransferase [Flavobacteriales bacterium]MBQ1968030.1 GNAT family N-acetyltransferase [Flavobacteriales bacterium]MBQ5815746.1 GNAT family N-acetyltransferase [Flavobacteriales bacterium]